MKGIQFVPTADSPL